MADMHLIPLPQLSEAMRLLVRGFGSQPDEVAAVASQVEKDLEAAGFEVLHDDREGMSPGAKFKDADLLGCPVQVVVGKRAAERVVELKPRAGGERRDLAAADLPAAVTAVLAAS